MSVPHAPLRARSRGVVAALLAVVAVLATSLVAEPTAAEPALPGFHLFDNGRIRFGGNGHLGPGAIEDSIGSAGNLRQPLYWSSSTDQWMTTTNFSRPLDFAVGTGTESDNWTESHVVENPAATPLNIDATEFFSTSSTGVGRRGYGALTATGTIEVNGAPLNFEHRYELGATDSFIQVTTRLTNWSAAPVENVHLWVGTRDDFLGTTDHPTKTRGNVVNGDFIPILEAGQPAQALRISSLDDAVLLYSPSTGADTAISSCCSFSNAYDTNPAASSIGVSGDGSYALHLPIGDLAAGDDGEVVWYYAAGSSADFDAMIGQVSATTPTVVGISGQNSVTATWSLPSSNHPITGYLVRWSTGGGSMGTPVRVDAWPRRYTVDPAEDRTYYRFEVAAITHDGISEIHGQYSDPSVQTFPGFPENRGLPTVTGTVLEGFTLSVFDPDSNWVNNSSVDMTATYQWQADGRDIDGATGTELELGADLVGKSIQVVASRSNDRATRFAVSLPTAPVASVRLHHLEVGGTTFDVESDALFTMTVPHGVTTVDLTATTFSSGASLYVDSTVLVSGSTRSLALAPGTNVFNIQVWEGWHDKTYRVTVIREHAPPPSPPSPPPPPPATPLSTVPPATPDSSLPTPPPEAADDTPTGFVHRLYLGLFGRLPEPVGLEYWSNVRRGGATPGQIAAAFLGSAEARPQISTLEADEFVRLLYRQIFDREPDTGGLAHWTQVLDAGRLSRAEVLAALVESPEMRRRILAALDD